MKRIKYSGNIPEYIDGFPKDCERSCKGSLHLLPNALRDITDGEYEFIKEKYPKVKVMVMPKEKPAIKKVMQTAQKAPTGAGLAGESKKKKKKR